MLQVPSSTCSDAHVLVTIVENMGPSDLLFCISYSGANADIIEALETAKRRKTPTMILTSVPKSAAAELSDVVLISAVRRTPLTPENVAARVARFVVVDIICAIIIALRKRSEPNEWTERITAEPSKRPNLNWVERANQESPKIR